MKKFYKLVSVHQEGMGYHIHLDGRPVKCPSGQILCAPTQKLAEALQAEWGAQSEEILPDTMPLTQILTTQIDRVARERGAIEAALLKYLDTDLICYRAGDDPPGQRAAQEESWDPWLEWFERRFGEKLQTTCDLVALRQPEPAHEKVRAAIAAMDDAHFTALQLVSALAGSIVLGLAFIEAAITPQQVFNAAHVEENFKGKIYNEEKYGLDPLEEKKRAALRRDLDAAARFLELLD